MDKRTRDLFSGNIPEDVQYIFDRLRSKNHEVFLVGGSVRNLILRGGYDPATFHDSDFDFTTSARPEEVIAVFRGAQNGGKVFTIPTGLSHGTVTVVVERDGVPHHYEVTTYRVDGTYVDGRHPAHVEFSRSLREDLSRRDFTVNAMAYDAVSRELYDPFNGMEDLEKKTIRTVGDPDLRFGEDGLRPVRACRIAAQLGFGIEQKTLDAIPRAREVVRKVSMERIHDEFKKLMRSEKPSVGIEYMRRTGILEIYLPELLEGYAVDQNEYHRHDVYYHNLYSCDAVPKDRPLVRLAALFHDIGKPRAKQYAITNGNGNVFYNHEIIGERIADRIMKRLKFSNSDMRTISRLVKMHMFYYTEEWSDGAVRRFLRKIDGNTEMLGDLFELRKADRIGSGLKSGEADILVKFRERIRTIIEADNALKVTDLEINGNDIMEHFRVKPSPLIGDMLEYMLEKVLDDPALNSREELLAIGEEFLKLSPENRKNREKEQENFPIMI